MSIKDNLEKAAALFGDSHEPECVVMTEGAKQKIVGGGFKGLEHEFSSGDFIDAFTQGYVLHFYIAPYCHGSSWLDKQDAIAIAKALGVTAEDLK